jgi:hypothetical protein
MLRESEGEGEERSHFDFDNSALELDFSQLTDQTMRFTTADRFLSNVE